jgi:enterochelin esterase-like enzyme
MRIPDAWPSVASRWVVLARLTSPVSTRERFCAVGAHSPALWATGGDSAPGAFDDAQNFAHNDVMGVAGAEAPYSRTAVWVDVGTQDPFRAAATRFADDLRAGGHAPVFHVWPGSHQQSYWQAHWNDYLQFYASALAHCRHA